MPVTKAKKRCAMCNRDQEGFMQPDGKFACPKCSPSSLFQHHAADWERNKKVGVHILKLQGRLQARGAFAAGATGDKAVAAPSAHSGAILDEIASFPSYWPWLGAATLALWAACFWPYITTGRQDQPQFVPVVPVVEQRVVQLPPPPPPQEPKTLVQPVPPPAPPAARELLAQDIYSAALLARDAKDVELLKRNLQRLLVDFADTDFVKKRRDKIEELAKAVE